MKAKLNSNSERKMKRKSINANIPDSNGLIDVTQVS